MPHDNDIASIRAMTNVAYVTEIMEFSRFGALSQVFVIEALTRYAATVAVACPEDLDTPGLSGAAWVGVAKEIDAKLTLKYGTREANG
ncbi:hypothetical protein [Comamonas terrigena]|uniref:hypothetical protein n=1 Tax=Comamonas terrigena TaxID=32013 RepID=UPI00244909FA|nr:hypothetical protein [Comamonas terrigena]MDH0051009.1 hypothetical protein [Comamonas terrigena]MDH0513502.1 hypothetical protein [Comamonas terrigena]MDH1092954.1 hypothetical protein [Comamonas terrigena]